MLHLICNDDSESIYVMVVSHIALISNFIIKSFNLI